MAQHGGRRAGESQLKLMYFSRSDGTLELQSRGGKRERNEPTAQQLQRQQVNGVSVWYEEVQASDPKHLDWRKKLGGMLMRDWYEAARRQARPGEQIDEPNMDEYCLSELPDNYRLYDHCRQSRGGASGKDRDRRDAYLYGHPGTRKKRFRSPADFYPHLKWLASDPDLDPANCECKLCTSDEIYRTGQDLGMLQEKQFGVRPLFMNASAKKAEVKKPSKDKKTSREAAPPAKPPVAAPSLPAVPTPVMSAPAAPANRPAPLPAARHQEQAVDLKGDAFLFRLGETTWFMRETGSLALATVVQRSVEAAHQQGQPAAISKPRYRLQPLSHPNRSLPQVDISDERKMFPWLAFSTPDPENPSLRGTTEHFDTIRWDQLPQDDSIVVDGSIFASRAVDETFTLVQQLTDPSTPTMEFEYNGIYLGSELIWAGEAVRYRYLTNDAFPPESTILVVSKILERIHTGSKPSEVFFLGDVYETRTVDLVREQPIPNELPEPVRRDVQYRSALRKRVLGQALQCNFVAGQRRVPLEEILGRWYESQRLFSIINPNLVQHAAVSGELPDCGHSLNSRGSNLAAGQTGVKKTKRIQAYTRSVPRSTTIVIDFENPFGSEPNNTAAPPSTLQMPAGESDRMSAVPPATNDNSGNMWHFVEMDQMDESGYGTMF